MSQFHYYKGPEKKGRWKPILEDKLPGRLEKDDTAFVTVLSVNERVIAKTQSISEDAKYCGPFYIDIDSDAKIICLPFDTIYWLLRFFSDVARFGVATVELVDQSCC